MMRETVKQNILNYKLIAIVRGIYGDACLHLAQALYDGGIRLLEVTFDQAHPDQWQKTTDTIALLNEKLGDKMDFGAGTVTSPELVELAQQSGARFIISPDTNASVIKATLAGDMVSIPGALTPTEVLTAHRCGADFVKIFPVGNLGAGYIQAVHAPINHVPLLAVGGIDGQNIGQYLRAGAVGVGVGGSLVNKKWIAAGEFEKITQLAREYVQAAKGENQ